jgi:hypothetical protein
MPRTFMFKISSTLGCLVFMRSVLYASKGSAFAMAIASAMLWLAWRPLW